MTGIGGIHVREQQLDGGARQIVLVLLGDQRAATGLGVELEHLRARPGMKHVAHSDGPNFPAHPSQRRVLQVQSAIQEERQSRAETIDGQPARLEHFHVGKAIG